MKTTTLPPEYLRPARPVVPRPLWERDRLFLEPDLPEQTDLENDGDDE
ncbi:hypothetical protein AB0G67_40120 [Streptomyces sp. NPDC021056]